MDLEEAKWIIRERIKIDRQMRDGDKDSDFGRWAEEQSQAMERVLEELERGDEDGTNKNIQDMETKHRTK